MRNLTDDEKKKLMEKIIKTLDDDFVDSMKNGNWGPSPVFTATSPSHNPYLHSNYLGISPTDVDAKGRYEYQEPEKDEQGTYYGYKVLHKNPNATGNCGCAECSCLISPRYPAKWLNGELHADHLPAEDTMYGIHFTKRPDHPELRQYYGRFHGAAYSPSWYEGSQEPSVLVKCALSGDVIIETEQGFRAEHAQIVGVFINGNWQSYQDYQEHTRAYTRPTPEDWKVNYRLTYGKPTKGKNGYWYADWDTSGDS